MDVEYAGILSRNISDLLSVESRETSAALPDAVNDDQWAIPDCPQDRPQVFPKGTVRSLSESTSRSLSFRYDPKAKVPVSNLSLDPQTEGASQGEALRRLNSLLGRTDLSSLDFYDVNDTPGSHSPPKSRLCGCAAAVVAMFCVMV